MEQLGPGAAFEIEGEMFEYKGTTPADNPEGYDVVGLETPDKPEVALHRVFSPSRMSEAIRIRPFNETFPYSKYFLEKQTWQRVLGPELSVPNPPQALVDVLERAHEKGLSSFEPHYIPPVRISKEGMMLGEKAIPYPSDWKRLTEDFWGIYPINVPSDKLNIAILGMPGEWVLFDASQKPPEIDGEYPNDSLEQIISSVTGKGTRNDLTSEEVKRIYRGIETNLHLASGQVRHMKVVEHNLLGNLFHPEFGESQVSEVFEDNINDPHSSRGTKNTLMGGGAWGSKENFHNGLGNVGITFYQDGIDYGPRAGFRPVITFPQESQPKKHGIRFNPFGKR